MLLIRLLTCLRAATGEAVFVNREPLAEFLHAIANARPGRLVFGVGQRFAYQTGYQSHLSFFHPARRQGWRAYAYPRRLHRRLSVERDRVLVDGYRGTLKRFF